jgi:hypothetical protein
VRRGKVRGDLRDVTYPRHTNNVNEMRLSELEANTSRDKVPSVVHEGIAHQKHRNSR